MLISKAYKTLLLLGTYGYSLTTLLYQGNLGVSSKFYIILLCTILTVWTFIPVNKTQVQHSIISPNIYFIVFGILFIDLIIFLNSYESFSGYFNRTTRDAEFFGGNTYVILDIIKKVFFIHLLAKRKWKITILILGWIILFDLAYLGARRTALFCILGTTYLALKNNDYLKTSRVFLSLLITGLVGFLFSGYRELLNSGLTINSYKVILLAAVYTNEFQLVSENLIRYINYTIENGPNPFYSFTSIFTIFIPRLIWSSKPLTLDKELDIFPNLFGEIFYNFGWFSIVVAVLIFNLLLKLFNKGNYLLSIFLFASVIDLFRTTINQYILTLILFYLLYKVSSYVFPKKIIL